MFRIKQGLNLPLAGTALPPIKAAQAPTQVALLGRDYHGLGKPNLLVTAGERVALGQPLFQSKQYPRVQFTAPACGTISAIERGERRSFQALIIDVQGDAEITFTATPYEQLAQLSTAAVTEQLLSSGLWTSFRTRPYSKVPAPDAHPAALFVTAIDTNPLAPDPEQLINARPKEFRAGLEILRHLTDGSIHLCQAAGAQIPSIAGVSIREFYGPHPAGLVGTHIHYLERVSQQRSVWHVGYQDLIAIGHLFLHGRILCERIISLAGPGVSQPQLLRTRIGACLSELVAEQLTQEDQRIISGSVLSGDRAQGAQAFLGRYHNQVSVVPEERQRVYLGWLQPGRQRFSATRLFISSFFSARSLPLGTSCHGSPRAMVPIGSFEKVMPLNLEITWLLRSLLTLDTDLAQQLGCLELDEEDLALCSFVCPGKIDYGYHLRRTLDKIEKEG